jgi:molybdenum cofactor guanylyltransferase
MDRLPVFILAGGRSSRFGTDKARAQFDGRPLILHVARMLEPAASHITVVADVADKYADLELPTIADDEPGHGPLGGLVTALRALRDSEALMLCSCDAVVVREPWLRALLTHRAAADERIEAVAFRGPHWQPMPALYHRTILPRALRHMGEGRRRMQDLLDAAVTAALPLPDDWPARWQVNTPTDLAGFS